MAALIAAPAIAQTQSATTQEQTCQKQGKCKGDKKRCGKGRKCGKGCRKGSASPAFKGVEMTPEQQAQVDTICSQAHATFRVSCLQAREAMAKEIDQKVQSVLTPEQFTVYAANKEQIKARKKANCPAQGCKEAEKKGSE